MTRDPALESQLFHDLNHPEGLSGRPMFGGLCYMLNGHMLCAARTGRLMFRTGKDAEPQALTLPGTEPMVQKNRRMPGYVWLSGAALSDQTIRRKLARMALDYVSTLPPKAMKC